jgi:hypothetical protein
MAVQRRVWWLAAVMLVASAGARATTPIMPLDEVKAGMKGHGLTVWHGTAIESFDLTVIGVLRGFDLQMDMILIRIDSGPVVTQKYNIVAGMSGSPIYIDGKLIGALAYGWEFQTTPVAGVTPIEQMLEHYNPRHPVAQAARARRAAAHTAAGLDLAAGLDPAPQPAPRAAAEGVLRAVDGPITVGGRSFREVQVAANHREAAGWVSLRPDLGVLTPVSSPLLVSGVPRSALGLLKQIFEPYNLEPMLAESAAAMPAMPAAAGDVDFRPGQAVGVALATGDIEFVGIGTLTYRDGDTVLAFGHPMMSLGACELPMTTAYITTVLPGLQETTKMGVSMKAIGTISQDRPTCIGGVVGKVAETIPLTYDLKDISRGADRAFRFKAARAPQLTEMICAMLLQGAMQNVAGKLFDGVMKSRIEIACLNGKGGAPVKIMRENSFDTKLGGPMGMNLPLFDLFTTLSALRMNPWGEAPVQSVDVSLEFASDSHLANIDRVQASKQVVRPGQTIDVTLYLKPYGAKAKPLTLPLKVPENAPVGRMIVVFIGGSNGSTLRPELNPDPAPKDVPSLINYLNSTVRNDSLLVEMVMPTHGLEFSGRILPDLPDPVAQALVTSQAEGVGDRRDVVERTVTTEGVIAGVNAIALDVVGEDGKIKADSGDVPTVDLGGGDANGAANGPMGGLTMAAQRQAKAVLGEAAEDGELTWLNTAPWADGVPAAMVRAALTHALASAPRWKSLFRPAATTARPRPAAEQPTADAPAADHPDGPPDVTGQLDLKKPPRLPDYKELDDVASGKLGANEAAGGENDEDNTEGGEEGGAVARPVKFWTLATAEDVRGGRFEGTFADNDGTVALAPAVSSLGRPEADRAWSVLPRPDGSVMVGSWGAKAKLQRLAGGKIETWAELDDAGLTALAALPDGSIAAGGSPSGRIYKISGPDKVEVLTKLGEPYVWSLAPDGHGGLFAATGNNGRVYQIDAKGVAKVILTVGDRHVTALAVAPDGGFYAGTFPGGKIYRWRNGQVQTVFQTEDVGVMGLAATPAGPLFVGCAGGKLYKVAADGASEQLLDDGEGDVYALGSIGDDVYAALSSPGRILRLSGAGDQRAQVYQTDEPYVVGLTANAKDAVYATVAASGEVVRLSLGSGERGSYTSEVHDAGMVARWGLVRWSQTLSGQGVISVQTRTGNTSEPDAAWSPWSTENTGATGAQVTSPPGRYVQVRLNFYGRPGDTARLQRLDLAYRTLNRAPVVQFGEPAAGAVVHETVKVTWKSGDPDDDDLTTTVYYAPAGSDKWTEIEKGDDEGGDTDADGGAKPAKPAKPGADAKPGGDKKPAAGAKSDHPKPKASNGAVPGVKSPGGESVEPAGVGDPTAPPTAPGAVKPHQRHHAPASAGGGDKGDKKGKAEELTLNDDSIDWDTTDVPDGSYVVKVVVSNAKRNPDDPKTTEVRSKPFVVVNSLPYALFQAPAKPAPLPATFKFGADGAWLASAEYKFDDDDDWSAWLPVEGLLNRRFEEFKAPAAPTEAGDHVLHMRVRDAAGNVLTLDWPFTVAEK